MAVERAGDRFVVVDAADPAIGSGPSGGECCRECALVAHFGWAARDRRLRRGRRQDVQVMVVKTGEKGSADGIDDLVVPSCLEGGRNL
jgi:hypothetical protein